MSEFSDDELFAAYMAQQHPNVPVPPAPPAPPAATPAPTATPTVPVVANGPRGLAPDPDEAAFVTYVQRNFPGTLPGK